MFFSQLFFYYKFLCLFFVLENTYKTFKNVHPEEKRFDQFKRIFSCNFDLSKKKA